MTEKVEAEKQEAKEKQILQYVYIYVMYSIHVYMYVRAYNIINQPVMCHIQYTECV